MYQADLTDIRDIIMNPVEAFGMMKEYPLSRIYLNYIIVLVLFTLFSGIIATLSFISLFTSYQTQLGLIPLIGPVIMEKADMFMPLLMTWNLFIVYLLFIFAIFAIFLKGLILHVFVILIGGEGGVCRTVKAVMGAAVPFFLIGWIPYIGWIGLVWSVILAVIGIKNLHDLSWLKAVLVLLIPAVLFITGGIFSVLLLLDVSSIISGISGSGTN